METYTTIPASERLDIKIGHIHRPDLPALSDDDLDALYDECIGEVIDLESALDSHKLAEFDDDVLSSSALHAVRLKLRHHRRVQELLAEARADRRQAPKEAPESAFETAARAILSPDIYDSVAAEAAKL